MGVITGQSLDDGAVLEVPNDQHAIFRAWGHVPVALADGDVDDHVGVAVEGCLEDKSVSWPNFDNPK